MKAVRFDRYGGIEVLQVADVPMPEPSHDEALVKGQGRVNQPRRGEDPRRAVARHVAGHVPFGRGQRSGRHRDQGRPGG
jgi:NADPH:quinone reductase